MSYGSPPSHPYGPPAKRPISGLDLGVSITALVLTVLFGVLATFMGFFMLAFLDHCPPETCSVDGAVTAVGGALLAAAAIGVTGLTLTIVQLVRRGPAWPFAVGTLALCVVACVLGGFGYETAVGG